MRGIRGAITVGENTEEAIGEATRRLLRAMMQENNISTGDIISVLFTMTSDLNAAFPATCARKMQGWNFIPMLCAAEVDVPGSMRGCIRVLMHAEMDAGQREVKHVYLDGAVELRPDLNN